MQEYLRESISDIHLHIKALAASDVLEGHFFVLGIPASSSRDQIEAARLRLLLEDDDDIGEDVPGSTERFIARMACDHLLGAVWGRA